MTNPNSNGPLDVLGHVLSPEIRKECQDIILAYNAFVERQEEIDPAGTIHPPSATFALYNSLFTSNYPFAELMQLSPIADGDDGEEWEKAFHLASVRCITLADVMFRFGQYCASQGLLHSNLTRCKCGDFDEEGLQKLLEGGC